MLPPRLVVTCASSSSTPRSMVTPRPSFPALSFSARSTRVGSVSFALLWIVSFLQISHTLDLGAMTSTSYQSHHAFSAFYIKKYKSSQVYFFRVLFHFYRQIHSPLKSPLRLQYPTPTLSDHLL
ncbi:hypothetical protein MPH_11236 [Macrophomina phaseolina MS6]|uniref:Uncharacterized protein n=1 Tax=Macrophomina phaseolina (strain MS6) TaxID=1126212 RepID=K2RB28_MACPH|nr:hypothetical protein MPH_11236 [Macrophomina phaseolina MS6]